MQPLRSFALRNYLTLTFCAATLVAFLGAGLSSVSGSKAVPASVHENENIRALDPLRDVKDANSPAISSLGPSRNQRSDVLNRELRPASLASPFAASLTATKTDNISTPVNPGGTIMYTVVITNTGTVDLTNVTFTDTIDPNTTMVGVVASSPIAFDDTYTATGNIPIAPAAGLLANDIDPDTGNNTGLTVTQVQGSGANVGVPTNTTATGIGGVAGSVTVQSNGTFTYEPPPGFTGNDTFTYQISDAGGKTGTGTVTIVISQMVWFIDNSSVAANSRGTFSQPFKTIANFNTVNTGAAPNPQPGDFIALRRGTGTYSEADGINLRDNQKLIGEAVQFNTVFTADANSSAAYNTFASGTMAAPSIVTTAGNGVDLGSGNTARGFDIGNTPGFFGFNGTAVGALTIGTLSKTGTGGAMNITTSGAFGSTVNFGTLESTSSPNRNLNLVGVTGTLALTSAGAGFSGSAATFAAISISGGSVSLTYTGNVTKANTGALLSVSAAHTGTLTFNTGTLSATNGTGLQFDNANGTYNFNGTTTLNGGDAGVDILNGSGGTFSFGSSTTITSPTGTAFNVNSSSPSVTYSGSITQNTSGQRVVNIDTTTSNTITFQTGTITGGANSTGININAANGNVTFSNGMTLGTSGSRMVNQAVTINGGGSSATYNLGTVSIFTSGAGAQGIAATNFDGMLNASGTVDANGASAINIVGPVGITTLTMSFTKVSANGGTNGIKLTNCGGSFTIAGDGGLSNNGSGGTISAATAEGILINVASNVSLGYLNINNSGTDGINTTGVNGFTLNRSNITDSAGGAVDDGVALTNTSGTVTISNCVITSSPHNGVTVDNNNTNMAGFSFTNNTVSCAAGAPCQPSGMIGNDGLSMSMRGTSVLPNGLVSSSSFSGVRAVGVQIETNDTGRIGVNSGNPTVFALDSSNSFIVQNNTFTGNGQGIDMNTSQVSNMTFEVLTNTINGISTASGGNGSATAINVFTAAGNDTGPASHSFVGKIDGNSIGTQGTKDSGSGFGNGIRVVVQGNNTQGDITVNNNTVRECAIATPLNFIGQNGAGNSATQNANTAHFKITNNTLPQPSGTNVDVCGTNLPCIDAVLFVLADELTPVCNVITGNNLFDATTMNGAADVYLAERAGPPAGAQLTVETSPNGTAVSTYVQANNTLAGANKFLDEGANVSNVNAGACGTFPSAPVQAKTMSANPESDDQAGDVPTTSEALTVVRTQQPEEEQARRLSPADLNWMVEAAIARWQAAGISAEDIARLRVASFELATLPKHQLASASGTQIRVDETAAGYGWFFDQTPLEDSEFDVEVPGKERQTSDLSPAHGRVDLLTVLVRELGSVYLQGKHRIPKKLRPLMETTLAPAVRRMPEFNVPIRSTSFVVPAKPSTDFSVAEGNTPAEAVTNNSESGATQAHRNTAKIPAEARHAVFNPAADRRTANNAVIRFNNPNDASSYAAIRAARTASFSPGAGMITVGPFTLPIGKSVTIMFSVTVNNPLPNGVCSVSNQGQVTSTEVPGPTPTDDPDAVGSTNPTVTQVVTPPSFTACQSNITTTTDSGVCTATRSFTATATGCPSPTVTCKDQNNTTITSPFPFPKGTTTVTCTAANGQSPNATCMFTVTVTDNQAPVLSNCTNKSVNTDPGQCTAAVTFTPAVTATDNCDGSVTPNCVPASGSTFPKGVTTVMCTATDSSNNQGTCSFTVTVTDNQPPVFTCPPNGGAFAASDCLPSQRSAYTGATLYSNGGNTVTNAVLFGMSNCTAPPSMGTTTISFTGTLTGDLSTGGPANHFQAPVTGSMKVTFNNQTGSTRTFDTEMLQLDISGGSLPAGVMLRESPTLASTGQTKITTVSGGFHIDSFFDVFVELSTNGGASWTPGTSSNRISAVQSTDPNQCSAVVNYATPTATDNCDGSVTVTCNPASGSTFTKGTTTVTCSASDTAMPPNTAMCSFTVTVVDTQLPSITCPANISVTGNACQVVNYTTPTPTDNCPMPTASCSPASGTCFAVGTTTVTCTATDMGMNSNTCTFTVTVTPCTITCPANINDNVAPGTCAKTVTYSDPTTTGTCGMVTCTPASGSSFPKGTTTVTCTTTAGPSCTFTVTIVDNQPPTITCPANVTQSTDPNQCQAVVNYTTPTGSDNCPLPPNAVVCNPASGSMFPKGTTTVTCTVTDGAGLTANCMFTVTVNDTQAPSITCPANVTQGTDPNQCQAVVNYAAPTVSDNCPGVGTPTCTPTSGSVFPKGTTTVNCTVSDASGNQANCSFTVTVNDTQPPTITCPASGGAFAASDCLPSDRLAYLGATYYSAGSNSMTNAVLRSFSTCTAPPTSGQITINFNATFVGDYSTGGPATRIQAPATGQMKVTFNNQSGSTRTFDTEMLQLDLSGGTLPANTRLRESPTLASTGQTKITNVSGGFRIDSFFDIFVELSTDGGMSWAPDLNARHIAAVQGTDSNQCTAVVNYPAPVVSDNCPGVGNPSCNPASGSTFAKGTTTVTCSVQDASMNSASCMFTVTVVDTQAPSMTCPANISVIGNTCQNVTYTTPTATDNCPGVGAVTCSPPSGTCFPVGTTTVTCSVSDAAGNQTSCSFTVQVIPCTITCPPDQTAQTGPGATQCGTVVNYPAPTTTGGGCGTVTCTPASGSFFPVGVTTVTCNTQAGPSCTFKVTVTDNTPPVFQGCGNVTSVTPTVGGMSAVVIYTNPTATDNCPPSPLPANQVVCNPPSGSTFPVGCSTVTCTATDGSGNVAMCSFQVCVFNICIQDDSNPNNRILINTATGDYRFCCNGVTYTGKGTIMQQGSTFTLVHNPLDRRLRASVNGAGSPPSGNASLQSPPGKLRCNLTDSNLSNNTMCQSCQ